MYLPSIVIVGYYFDKKRAFATGLATCGSGEHFDKFIGFNSSKVLNPSIRITWKCCQIVQYIFGVKQLLSEDQYIVSILFRYRSFPLRTNV